MSSDADKPSREKASKIPSWIMVGFILGGLAFYSLNDYLNRPAPPAPLTSEPPASAKSETTNVAPPPAEPETQSSLLLKDAKQMSLYAMDVIFRQWAVNAMWDYNTAQVIFWNPADKAFSIAVEVTRYGSEGEYDYSYRLLDKVTRPVIRDVARSDTPILFTENDEGTQRREEEQRRRWLGR